MFSTVETKLNAEQRYDKLLKEAQTERRAFKVTAHRPKGGLLKALRKLLNGSNQKTRLSGTLQPKA